MKIKNKLYSLAGLTLLLAVVHSSIVYYSSTLSKKESKQYQTSRLIQNITFAMNKTTQKYLANHKSNAQRKWLNKKISLISYLDKLKIQNTDKQKLKIITSMINESNSLDETFKRMVLNDEDIDLDRKNNEGKEHIKSDLLLRKFLTSSLLRSTQNLITLSDKLAAIVGAT